MRVLAVDTATPNGSVALVRQGTVEAEVRFGDVSTHSAWVVPAVEFVLGRSGLRPEDVDGFAATVGPGSFTGLRIGLGTVQGMALAAARPSVGLPTLDVLAARIEGLAATLVCLIDAFRGEVYARVYDGAAVPRGPAVVAPPGEVVEGLPPRTAFFGDGALRYRALIEERAEEPVFPRRSLFLGGTLGRLAGPLLESGRGGPPEQLRPLYLRAAAIRDPRR